MKAAVFWFYTLALLFLVSCGEKSSKPSETQVEVLRDTQILFTPPPQEVPYPVPNTSGAENAVPTLTAALEQGNDLTEGDLSPTASPIPTVHVDVTMRATDPEAFVLASGRYQLVEFFAFWCPTCKSMTPVLKNLEHKYSGKIQFIYLDIDDPRTNSYKQILGFQYQPHVFLIDGEGRVVKQWVGYVTEEELDAVLSTVQ